MNLNFSHSAEQMKEKEQQQQQAFNFGLNHHQIVSSSSSSASSSCHIFFNPSEDHAGFYHPQLYQPHQEEYYGYHHGAGSSYEIENKVENGVKLSVCKREEDNGVKWMSSKMTKINEVKKVMSSSSVETDLSSSYNCNSPIRVCSDCHTTKTPLWRSGPKGPKSLCNACGIRQRKARRAMAAAANGGGVASSPPRVKEKMAGKRGHASQLKKRCKLAAGSSTSSGKKIDFEDFLINLSNKLAFHYRVFPQDEKEAAILLMALSSGLVHG